MKGASHLLLVLCIYACEGRDRSSRSESEGSSFRNIARSNVDGPKSAHSAPKYVDYEGSSLSGGSLDVSGHAAGIYNHEELDYLQQQQLKGQEGLSSVVHMTAKEEERLRYLQGGIPTFTPLTCNENIVEADCMATKLSVLVADSIGAGGADEVVIPCGTCAYWDYDQSSSGMATAPGGINIVGKLHVPSTAHGTLRFPHMIIQGVLQIDPPAPGNLVKFLLYGSEDVFFHPHPDNAHVCDATNGCKVGKKPIVVAGGVLQVRGIDSPDCPSWVKLMDIVDVDRKTIEVGPDAASCWNIGDEILLTSPLMFYSFREVATIESVDAIAGMLNLTKSLPEYFVEATGVADPDFCVEVASLSRRVVFDAEKDDPTNNYKIGGHLMVLLTPNVAQTLEGVELQNFGQQGNLGRYPIHFHICADVYGSYVSKNVIRNSNQRCVVIHGSDNVHIYDNVAFETHGHCYFTEDGIETGNTFERNLGASTMKPEFVINGENDNLPSTFWITNAQNHWMDNVAAGADFSGFWFDTRTKVRGPSYEGNENYQPMYIPLGTFRDNVAHSNLDQGMALYSPGYKPTVEAVFENSKTYRNKADGWLVHGNRNIAIIGGIVADNKMGINNFRASDMRFENMTIIGYSEAYERVRAIQDENHLCFNNEGTDWMVGMFIHPWRFLPNLGTQWGVAVKDVVFRRFGPETFCTASNTAAIEMSTNQVQLHQDCPNRFENIVFEAGTKRIDACEAMNHGIENLSIEDVDGSVSPTGTPGFFVSDHLAMTTFAGGTSACSPVFGSCLVFCEGACLRQVTFKVSNALPTQNIEMVVSNGVESATTKWRQFDAHKDENTQVKVNSHGIFAATVPAGNYDISFRYIDTKAPAWPDYVFVEHEIAPECNNFDPIINLLKPPVTSERCSELIKGGDFEDGTFNGWHQQSAELQITTEWSTSSTYALRVIKRRGKAEGASQSLDVSCLVEDFTYDLTADIRLEDDQNTGVEIFCDPANGDCPVVVLSFHTWDPSSKVATSTSKTIGTVVSSQQENSWYKIEGTITLTAQEASADRVELTFENPRDYNHIIDNVRLWTDDVQDATVSPTLSPTGSPTLGPTASPPTYNEFGAAADAYLRSNRQSNKYGERQVVEVADGGAVRLGIFKFDLGQNVPSNAASLEAKLQLFVTFTSNDETRTIEVRRVGETPTWDEATVTWDSYYNAQPSTVQISTNQLVISTNDVGSVVEVDISDIVEGKVAEGGGLLVLELGISSGNSSGNKVKLRSKEGEAVVPEPGPKLIVTTGAVDAGIR